jgi:hypothetical protein
MKIKFFIVWIIKEKPYKLIKMYIKHNNNKIYRTSKKYLNNNNINIELLFITA